MKGVKSTPNFSDAFITGPENDKWAWIFRASLCDNFKIRDRFLMISTPLMRPRPQIA